MDVLAERLRGENDRYFTLCMTIFAASRADGDALREIKARAIMRTVVLFRTWLLDDWNFR
jgi:hypothetical protein